MRILIAEDEALIALSLADSLEAEGHRVALAFDGAEALAEAQRMGGALDLLVTDLNMPGLTGEELIRALRAERPGRAPPAGFRSPPRRRRARLLDAAAGHAAMAGLDDDGDAKRMEHGLDRVGDLRRHPFLDLQPPGVDLDQPGQLGDADHALARQVGNMRPAEDGRHVVLAMRDEADVAQQHDPVIAAALLEGPFQQPDRILVVAGEPVGIGAEDAVRRVHQALAAGIVAGPADQRPHRRLGLGARGAADRPAAAAVLGVMAEGVAERSCRESIHAGFSSCRVGSAPVRTGRWMRQGPRMFRGITVR